jgi:molybdate transport system substrate-binding protein
MLLRWRAAVLVAVAVLGVRTSGQAPPGIAVAAAADLQAVLPELASRFERAGGGAAALSFGSSGNFFAQIQNGAPFDVFMSADVEYPRRLVAGGLAEADTLVVYAIGRIVLWTRKDRGLDVGRGLAILAEPRVARVAIANPGHAPYGRAAEAALQHEHVYDVVRRKLVYGENISQAAQLVESGNADAGILALSLALGPALVKSGVYFEIPATAHPPIEQAAVVISSSTRKDAARRFVAALARPDAAEALRRFGFMPPAARPRGQ